MEEVNFGKFPLKIVYFFPSILIHYLQLKAKSKQTKICLLESGYIHSRAFRFIVEHHFLCYCNAKATNFHSSNSIWCWFPLCLRIGTFALIHIMHCIKMQTRKEIRNYTKSVHVRWTSASARTIWIWLVNILFIFFQHGDVKSIT